MKIEVREVNGAVRMDLTGENAREWAKLREFVELLNGKPIDKGSAIALTAPVNPVLDASLRVESVGFDGDGSIESIAIEGVP